MRFWVRKLWFRLAVLFAVLLIVTTVIFHFPREQLRSDALKSLQGATLIFAICSAVSLALFSNYVKGVRDSYMKQLTIVRGMLNEVYDDHKDSADQAMRQFVTKFVVPLLDLGLTDWLAFEPINAARDNSEELAEKFGKKNRTFVSRYLLRFEDELNELGRIFVRRIVLRVHVQAMSGSFLLVAFAVACIGFSFLVPDSAAGDVVICLVVAAIVTLAVLELFVIISYLQQEASEESDLRELDAEELTSVTPKIVQ